MAGNSEDTDPEETEAMEIDVGEVLPSMPKWPLNVNKSPELEKHAESSLPPSVFLRQVEGALFPVYVLNVRIVDIKPRQSEIQLVRGHCPYYSCNSTVTHVNWALAGPLKFGKLLRPYCPDCCQIRRKRYLNLYFYLELVVEDNLGQICKIISTRDAAVRFFGMTVYQFVTNSRRRQKIKGQLETLLEASSSSRSDPVPGFTFEARIIPVAQDSTEQVQFYMFGDNPPLFYLAKRCKS